MIERPYDPDTWIARARACHPRRERARANDYVELATQLGGRGRELDVVRAALLVADDKADLALDLLAPHRGDPDIDLAYAEAIVHASSKRMREALPGILDALAPTAANKRRLERLAHLAIFTLAVGPKHDGKNGTILAAIERLADRLDRPALRAALEAKRMSPAEICSNIGELAKKIPDVRIVRLLLRERLATIADPRDRLELFATAMERIPNLDGIAHDYLQLLHLVAKRALAIGDTVSARSGWNAVLERDPDNLAAQENLYLLAPTIAAADRLTELRAIYAVHSPRADLVLARLAAIEALRTSDSVAAEIESLARLAALQRLATDETARPGASSELVRRVVATRPEPMTDAVFDEIAAFSTSAGRTGAFATRFADLLAKIDRHRELGSRLAALAPEDIGASAVGSAMIRAELAQAASQLEQHDIAAGHDLLTETLDRWKAVPIIAQLSQLHGMLTWFVVHDLRIPIAQAVDRARAHALIAITGPHDPKHEEVAAAATARETVAGMRATALVDHHPRQAMEILFWFHTNQFVSGGGLQALAWRRIEDSGSCEHRYLVARALLNSTLQWQSTVRPQFGSVEDVQVHEAKSLVRHWATSALQRHTPESPISRADIEALAVIK